MKLWLLVLTYLIVAVKSAEIADEKLMEDKLCIQAIQEALDVATIDDQIYESTVKAINDKIESDCENILDVLVEKRSFNTNADRVVTITVDENNNIAVSVNGVSSKTKQYDENDSKSEVTSFIAIFMFSLYKTEWHINGVPIEESNPLKPNKVINNDEPFRFRRFAQAGSNSEDTAWKDGEQVPLLRPLPVLPEVNIDNTAKISSGILNKLLNKKTPATKSPGKDDLVKTIDGGASEVINGLLLSDNFEQDHINLDTKLDNKKSKVNELPSEQKDRVKTLKKKPFNIENSKDINDETNQVMNIDKLSETDGDPWSQKQNRFSSYLLGKPTCKQNEKSYCNLNCISLTCENYAKEMPDYLICITAKYHQVFCLFGTWSKCACDIGFVKDEKNGGKCIPSEYCPQNKSTTQNPNTTKSTLSSTTSSTPSTTRKPTRPTSPTRPTRPISPTRPTRPIRPIRTTRKNLIRTSPN